MAASFLSARAAEEGVQVRKVALEQIEGQLKVASRRYEVGESTVADVARWQSEVAAAKQAYIVAKGDATFALHSLARLTGVDGIEAGNVSINTLEASLPETPFGGVKHSGFGREGGTEGLHNYMTVKNVMHSFDIV